MSLISEDSFQQGSQQESKKTEQIKALDPWKSVNSRLENKRREMKT